ncbi:MAG TPA: hypothetical protein VJ872_13940, partial [Nocardioides sp.]|nr:hypothetical protein [Nocardioides sp.]
LLALTAHDRLPAPDPAARAELLLALANARLRAGRTDEGHRVVAQALALARSLDDAELFARAALLAATGLAFNAVQLDAIDLLREADRRFGDEEGDAHAAVVARLAELVAVEDRAEALRIAVRAGELAPDLPAALAARLEVEWGRHDPRDALERAQRLASLVTDPATAARAATWVMVFALELGDVTAAAAAVATLQHLADRSRQPALAHLAASRRATIATVRGDAAGGLAAVREARDLAARFGLADGEAVAWGQLFTVGRIAELTAEERAAMERTARELAAASPYPIAHDGAVVQMLLAEGREAEARELFERLMGLLDGLEHDLLRTWSLALLAEDAVALGDAKAAARIHAELAPYDGRLVVAAGGVACLGPVSDHLRRLAGVAQRGVTLESADGIVTLRLGADVVQLPTSLGLTQLAVLLANPGSDVAATRLAAPAGAEVPREGGADEVLDRRALAAYRTRLAEIDAELEEARGWSDDGRVERLQDERDALLAELRGDLGLGGRPRRFTDEAERARVNVTRAIRSAIRRVGERAPAIGEHLERSVTTGARCRYDPGQAALR